ncbi:MAG: ferritin-like domain-containing protein [Solirubrobacterales bacterium]|mgnify:FL=1|nr:ferritin-like domain-containing protein [Solirubrobacterales bacterium]
MSSTDQPDRPGALRRAVADPMSRRRLFAVAGGAGAAATLLAACGGDDDTTTSGGGSTSTMEPTTGMADGDALAQFGEGDVGILNYALTLEYLEAAFYADVAASGLFKGADLKLIRSFGRDEAEHVVALRDTVRAMGAKPAAKPRTEFPLDSAEEVLDLAATVENLGAAAYLGQAPRIESGEVLAAALSIHAVEGRHAAALNTLVGESFVPDGPFAKPADAATVLDAVQPYIA